MAGLSKSAFSSLVESQDSSPNAPYPQAVNERIEGRVEVDQCRDVVVRQFNIQSVSHSDKQYHGYDERHVTQQKYDHDVQRGGCELLVVVNVDLLSDVCLQAAGRV